MEISEVGRVYRKGFGFNYQDMKLIPFAILCPGISEVWESPVDFGGVFDERERRSKSCLIFELKYYYVGSTVFKLFYLIVR